MSKLFVAVDNLFSSCKLKQSIRRIVKSTISNMNITSVKLRQVNLRQKSERKNDRVLYIMYIYHKTRKLNKVRKNLII